MKSPAEGAAAERQAITRHLRRIRKGGATIVDLDDLLMWIRARHLRYQAKPGGLGRRKQ